VSLARLALLGLLFAAVTSVPPAAAEDEHCSAESCDDECPADCPPGCNDACACCLRVRADTDTSVPRVPPPVAQQVEYVRVVQATPSSADVDERDAVPRA
jgi:hypothetical protein